jgi:hypothetical protein
MLSTSNQIQFFTKAVSFLFATFQIYWICSLFAVTKLIQSDVPASETLERKQVAVNMEDAESANVQKFCL